MECNVAYCFHAAAWLAQTFSHPQPQAVAGVSMAAACGMGLSLLLSLRGGRGGVVVWGGGSVTRLGDDVCQSLAVGAACYATCCVLASAKVVMMSLLPLLLPLQCAGLRPAPIRFGDEVPEGDTAVVRRDVIVPARAIAVSGDHTSRGAAFTHRTV
jgi:hypothetical protein